VSLTSLRLEAVDGGTVRPISTMMWRFQFVPSALPRLRENCLSDGVLL